MHPRIKSPPGRRSRATRARLLAENLGDYAPSEVVAPRSDGAARTAKYQAALDGGHDVLVLISEVWGGFSPEAIAGFVSSMERVVTTALGSWNSEAEVTLLPALKRLAFEAVMNALGAYFILLLLSALFLDGGIAFRVCLAATGIHFTIALWILVRRINDMSRGDYLVVSCGLMNFPASPSFRLMDAERRED